VGLDSQPADIIDLHARLFKKHGISTIRNFDALNDVNNLIHSARSIKAAGLRHEATVTMMALPPGATGAHDPDFYESVVRSILKAEIPFDSICFKDASGTATPSVIHETITRARKILGGEMPIVFHSHETAGISIAQYMAAIQAGASQVDLSMAPVSGGTCQPDIITLWHALRGSEFTLDIDIDKVMEAEEVFKECMKDYFLPPEATMVNPLIPFSPLPGGALTANTQMLRDNGLMDRFHEITMAMGEVVMRGGFGTSVTPVSQFYFQQAFNNVLHGPWKKIVEGYGKMVLGYFGRTPLPPDPEIVRIASEQMGLEPTDRPVVEINDADPTKGVAAASAMLQEEGLPITDENIFIAAACREKGILYLKGQAKVNIRRNSEETAQIQQERAITGSRRVFINGREYAVEITEGQAMVNGRVFSLSDASNLSSADHVQPSDANPGQEIQVRAPLPGLVLRIRVKKGQKVREGQVLLVMEAMKMETEIFAPSDGKVSDIKVAQGDQKKSGDILVLLQGDLAGGGK